MTKRFTLWSVVALVVLLLVLNLFAGGGPAAMVRAARNKTPYASVGPTEDMKVIRYECDDGIFGFGGHGVVDFVSAEKSPSRAVRVILHKRVNWLGWEVASSAWTTP